MYDRIRNKDEVDGCVIKDVDSLKNLDVTIDKKINFKENVNYSFKGSRYSR